MIIMRGYPEPAGWLVLLEEDRNLAGDMCSEKGMWASGEVCRLERSWILLDGTWHDFQLTKPWEGNVLLCKLWRAHYFVMSPWADYTDAKEIVTKCHFLHFIFGGLVQPNQPAACCEVGEGACLAVPLPGKTKLPPWRWLRCCHSRIPENMILLVGSLSFYFANLFGGCAIWWFSPTTLYPVTSRSGWALGAPVY